ncbi:galactokinase [Piscirickettsia litoralis]|uniref:Galactokinase n=1 Tax=Piscirickettsia litoralis TaxID=1891921 RepID=A0ABX3A1Q6_9GAMM|nr:galactokinase [Piscirickettsia litoralis]ODN42378.1 galactokinase [Piscirickettsia litoralis]
MKFQLNDTFTELYKKPAQWHICSPGRVNLIGEHTDYNHGFVMPMAIDKATHLFIRPRQDSQVNLYAANFENSYSFLLDQLRAGEHEWGEYAKGMAWAIHTYYQKLKYGFDAVVYGDIPIGAGLSSSAAFELAIGQAFCLSNSLNWDPVIMAKLAQQAENEWVKVNCGIMDQFICSLGQVNHALLIDCDSLEYEQLPLPHNTKVIIMDTATRRGLVESAYNERREQCEAAAESMAVETLRTLGEKDLPTLQTRLDKTTYARAKHVISENARVLEAKQALLNNDPIHFGKLMVSSHESLCQDFEVSSEALDTMVQIALDTEGCFGARMTGAGFGGCAIALVRADEAEQFVKTVTEQYQKSQQMEPYLYICAPSQGCSASPIN